MRESDPVMNLVPSADHIRQWGAIQASVERLTRGYDASNPGVRAELRRMGWSLIEEMKTVVEGSLSAKPG